MATADDPTTWYRIEHDGVTVHTQDADTAEEESHAGARVTAATVGGVDA